MKRTNLFLILILGVFINTSSVLGSAKSDFFIKQDVLKTKLNLKGTLYPTNTKSVTVIPIEASIDADLLLLDFKAAVNKVVISIIDVKSEKAVESSSYSITNPQIVSIALADFSTGDYRVEITNEEDGYVYGDFVID